MSKIIGIPVWKTGENSVGVSLNYLEYAAMFGTPRMIMPEEEFVDLDLLMLPGGPDLMPQSYGQTPSFRTGHSDLFKQFFFDKRLDNYIEQGTPIFGICLGMQMLAAKCGVPLRQHLHMHAQSPDRWKKGHTIKLETLNPYDFEGIKLVDNINVEQDVNSHHHQAVLLSDFKRVNDVNAQLGVIATAKCEDNGADRIIEAFFHLEKPIIGVQWHPEEFYDRMSTKLVESLLTF